MKKGLVLSTEGVRRPAYRLYIALLLYRRFSDKAC